MEFKNELINFINVVSCHLHVSFPFLGGVIMYGALLLFEDEFIHIVAISFSSLILTELIMVALNIRTWHYLMVLAELFSLALYGLSLVVLHDYFGKETNWY